MQEIKLTKGYIALIDDEDYERISKLNWYADVGKWNVYAKNDFISWRPRMHAFIMHPVPDGFIVHHEDGDGLHNMRSNLKVITHAEHTGLSSLRKNKFGSLYRGVSRHRDGFVAEIWVNYEKHYLGKFSSELDAAMAYADASSRVKIINGTAILGD